MSENLTFASKYANHIWESLYTVLIPDIATLNPDYIRIRGIPVSGNKTIDSRRLNEFTTVMLPIIDIMYYFEQGYPIQIPSREDMIRMHENIELYLNEWRDYIRTSVHGQIDANNHKDIILGLENLSKYIYDRLNMDELVNNNILFNRTSFGLVSPLAISVENNRTNVYKKPKYNSIRNLIRRNTKDDIGGRF